MGKGISAPHTSPEPALSGKRTVLRWQNDGQVKCAGQRFELFKHFALQAAQDTGKCRTRQLSSKSGKCAYSLWKDSRHNNNKQHSERLLPAPRERYAFISKRSTAVPVSIKYLLCNSVGHKIATPCSLCDYLAGSFDFAVKAHVSITLLSGASHHQEVHGVWGDWTLPGKSGKIFADKKRG